MATTRMEPLAVNSRRARRLAWPIGLFGLALAMILAPAAEAGWRAIVVPTSVGVFPIPDLVDRNGTLWGRFATGTGGCWRYDGATWTNIVIDGKTIVSWGNVLADSVGDTWIVGGSRWDPYPTLLSETYRFDGRSWMTLTTADGLARNSYTSGLVDPQGVVWLAYGDATGITISRFDGQTWSNSSTTAVTGDFRLRCIDSSGTLWFGGEDRRVARFDGASWTEYTLPSQLPLLPASSVSNVQSIFQDRAGGMWFASNDAVARLEEATLEDKSAGIYRSSTGDRHFISSAFADRHGTPWLYGYVSGNVYSYDGTKWRPLPEADLPSWTQPIEGGFCDMDGGLWVGQLSTIWHFDGEIIRDYAASGEITPATLTTLCASNGDVWGISGPDVDRFDGLAWTHYSASDGLPDDGITTLCEDHQGGIWAGGLWGSIYRTSGLSRFDGSAWTQFTDSDGVGSAHVNQIVCDARGDVWVLGNSLSAPLEWSDVLSRFDGTTWSVFTGADSLPFNYLYRAYPDREGNLWCFTLDSTGQNSDIYRYDGGAWTLIPKVGTGSGGGEPHLWEDRRGGLWCSDDAFRLLVNDRWEIVPGGVGAGSVTTGFAEDSQGTIWWAYGVRFDGTSSTTPVLSGMYSVIPDWFSGKVWYFGDSNGAVAASNFDGEHFRLYGPAQGFPSRSGYGMLADSAGGLWFSGGQSVFRYTPDRASPIVGFLSKPAPVVASGAVGATFAAIFEPGTFAEYSYRLDGSVWSNWSQVGSWSGDRLPDGAHVLEVQGRDYSGNVSAHPVIAKFEVDATPPFPAISSPPFGSAIRGTAEISGSASDARFDRYWIDYRPTGAATWIGAVLISESSTPVVDGILGAWDTSSLPDGGYDLRLSVADSLGLVGAALTTIIVDNHAPFFDETAPATVTAALGGDVYTTNAETHIYFPPRAFAQDAVVMVTAADPSGVPASLPSGAVKVLDGFDIAWAGLLKKPARFTVSYAGVTPPTGTLALYHSPDGSAWERLGGTVDENAHGISLALSAPGRYALYADNGLGDGTASLSSIAFTPRVFSPAGHFANRQVGISFRLGKPAPVTVKVFSKSGRLIREVAAGQPMQAGENLIHWDGTDRNGGIVVDGVYLVTVEALGRTETKTLAVVK